MIVDILNPGFCLCLVCSSDEITASFRRFGPLIVDWPHKAESKSYFPPKGNAQIVYVQFDSSYMYSLSCCLMFTNLS